MRKKRIPKGKTADEKHKGVLNAQVTHTICLLSQDGAQGLHKKMLNRGTVSTVTQGFSSI